MPHPQLHANGPLGAGVAASSSREDLIEERLRHELHQTQACSPPLYILKPNLDHIPVGHLVVLKGHAYFLKSPITPSPFVAGANASTQLSGSDRQPSAREIAPSAARVLLEGAHCLGSDACGCCARCHVCFHRTWDVSGGCTFRCPALRILR